SGGTVGTVAFCQAVDVVALRAWWGLKNHSLTFHMRARGRAACVVLRSRSTWRGLMTSIDRQIACELGVREEQVAAAVALLDGGATVPFIARYRKEATGGLDDAQLRRLDERLRYLRELEERRTVILNSIREQGKLDKTLEAAVLAADNKARL